MIALFQTIKLYQIGVIILVILNIILFLLIKELDK